MAPNPVHPLLSARRNRCGPGPLRAVCPRAPFPTIAPSGQFRCILGAYCADVPKARISNAGHPGLWITVVPRAGSLWVGICSCYSSFREWPPRRRGGGVRLVRGTVGGFDRGAVLLLLSFAPPRRASDRALRRSWASGEGRVGPPFDPVGAHWRQPIQVGFRDPGGLAPMASSAAKGSPLAAETRGSRRAIASERREDRDGRDLAVIPDRRVRKRSCSRTHSRLHLPLDVRAHDLVYHSIDGADRLGPSMPLIASRTWTPKQRRALRPLPAFDLEW